MQKLNRWLLTILSAVLLVISWPVAPFTGFIFIAWVPLLVITATPIKKLPYFLHLFIVMLGWNAGTTWWIWNSTDVGSIAAIIANSLLMCVPWLGYRTFFHKYGRKTAYGALIFFWMSFEFIHLNWQISWPWLTLGNVFAAHPNWVQWYEFTGVGGGTLLILLVNIALYEIWIQWKKSTSERNLQQPIWLLVFLSVGMAGGYAYFRYRKPAPSQNAIQVLVVQPNINPYTKFTSDSLSAQVKRLVALSRSNMDSNTRLVIWPETALSAGDWQENTRTNSVYQPVFEWLAQNPRVSLLSGIELFVNYGSEKTTPSARSNGNGGYYDAMNAAVMANAHQPLQYYYKSKLVPGVETLPDFLRVMAPLFEQFGGTSGGYGKSTTSAVLSSADGKAIVAPIICYESIYGEYVGSYVKKGANLLAIITNDGWWGNTPGHKQHLQLARLRAIETRKWVVRSANTGISAIISPNGDIIATQPWDTMATIQFSVPLSNYQSLYVLTGDAIYNCMLLLAVISLCWHYWHWLKTRWRKK